MTDVDEAAATAVAEKAASTGGPSAPFQAKVNSSAVDAVYTGMQVFGGITQTWEHVAHLYLREVLSGATVLATTADLLPVPAEPEATARPCTRPWTSGTRPAGSGCAAPSGPGSPSTRCPHASRTSRSPSSCTAGAACCTPAAGPASTCPRNTAGAA
ncbi:hypothetical protein [Streptomyces sp. NPDC050121]|uniref:hypothetical protein n=1 Tax=Streptomyces sp. NPDC050121 TaxID=3365601 RepID=UPI00379A07B7